MTSSIGSFVYEVGTEGDDEFFGDESSRLYFGLAGDDSFSNDVLAGESYFVGGTGADTYTVSPQSFTVIHETGGSADDRYIDVLIDEALNPLVATIDARHLFVQSQDASSVLLIVDWELPENRIETFSLINPLGELEDVEFDEFREIVLDLDTFIGDFTFEDLGFVGTLGDDIQAAIDLLDNGAPEVPLTPAEAVTVALLYEAGLGRSFDAPGLNFWIDQREDGFTERDLAAAFVDSPEFLEAVGDPDELGDQELVEALYVNILDRPGDAGGIAFWTSVAGMPGVSDGDLLLAFATADENRDAFPELDGLSELAPGFWDIVLIS